MTKPSLAQVLPTHPSVTWEDGRPLIALGFRKNGQVIWPFRGGSPDDPPADDKKFTQAELDAINARTRSEAERGAASKAHKELMKNLGLPEDTKPEDVKSVLDAAKKAELDALSAGDRATREAADAKAAAERAQAAADQKQKDLDQERHDLKLDALLERAGVGVGEEYDKDPDKKQTALDRAKRLLDVEVGADSDVIRKAIGTLQTDIPGLFGDTGSGGGGGGGLPDARPGSGPNQQRQTGGKSGVAAGREEAIKRGWIKDTSKAS